MPRSSVPLFEECLGVLRFSVRRGGEPKTMIFSLAYNSCRTWNGQMQMDHVILSGAIIMLVRAEKVFEAGPRS